ncbi:hypothetical protein UT300005_32330 [Clostridium sp. CTA-5]
MINSIRDLILMLNRKFKERLSLSYFLFYTSFILIKNPINSLLYLNFLINMINYSICNIVEMSEIK